MILLLKPSPFIYLFTELQACIFFFVPRCILSNYCCIKVLWFFWCVLPNYLLEEYTNFQSENLMNKILTHGNRIYEIWRFGRPVEIGMEGKRHMLYPVMDRSNFIQVDSVMGQVSSLLFTQLKTSRTKIETYTLYKVVCVNILKNLQVGSGSKLGKWDILEPEV